MEKVILFLDSLLLLFTLANSYGWVAEVSRRKQMKFALFFFAMTFCWEAIEIILFPDIDRSTILYQIFSQIWGLFYFFIYYLYFRYFERYSREKSLFVTFLLMLLYRLTHVFLSITVSSITGDEFVQRFQDPYYLGIGCVTYFFIKQTINYFNLTVEVFDNKDLYPFLRKIFSIFVLLEIISVISDTVSEMKHLNSFASILSTMIYVCLLLSFLSMRAHKLHYDTEMQLKQKKFEQKQLQRYTDEIVSLYNEIRGFRHDYAGMLVSMQMAIDSKDLQEVDRIYTEVLSKANLKLRSDKYTYFDLNNIGDSALQSVVAQAIFYAHEKGVEFTLEVKDMIPQLQIELLDLVRVMTILLNNAVEGAFDSYVKQVNVALVMLDREILMIIQNSCEKTNIHSEDLFELGFSTKGENRGMGLNNVKEILAKYEELILETSIENRLFTQIIRVRKNEI